MLVLRERTKSRMYREQTEGKLNQVKEESTCDDKSQNWCNCTSLRKPMPGEPTAVDSADRSLNLRNRSWLPAGNVPAGMALGFRVSNCVTGAE